MSEVSRIGGFMCSNGTAASGIYHAVYDSSSAVQNIMGILEN
jgi:hypothetical protein